MAMIAHRVDAEVEVEVEVEVELERERKSLGDQAEHRAEGDADDDVMSQLG